MTTIFPSSPYHKVANRLGWAFFWAGVCLLHAMGNRCPGRGPAGADPERPPLLTVRNKQSGGDGSRFERERVAQRCGHYADKSGCNARINTRTYSRLVARPLYRAIYSSPTVQICENKEGNGGLRREATSRQQCVWLWAKWGRSDGGRHNKLPIARHCRRPRLCPTSSTTRHQPQFPAGPRPIRLMNF